MTGTKTSMRMSPLATHPTGHAQSHRVSKKSTTPSGNPSRIPPSVGQPLPPTTSLRSPGVQHARSRTPSPNYFGLSVDSAVDPQNSEIGAKANWSPPTSSIRSFVGMSPQHVPLDSNPDFEAFRRQTEAGNGFNLGHGGSLSQLSSGPQSRSKKASNFDAQELSPKSFMKPQDFPAMDIDGDADSAKDSAYVSATDSRHASSANLPSFFDLPRQESPTRMSPVPRNVLSHLDDRHPRLSLPQNKADPPSPHFSVQHRSLHQRADTLPSCLDDGPVFIPPSQLKDIIERLPSAQFLLLDLRVFPQFSQSRIKNALNLCIPTTLLKRPSFNLQKLQDTFTNEIEKKKFSEWKSTAFIVVYDAYSSDKKDATSAINTLKKFSNEGYKGQSYIVKGGFAEISKHYPKLVGLRSSQEMQKSKISLSLGTSAPDAVPVAGGCLMPASKNPTMPFFSNIRQNQDLIGGVGQLDLQLPQELDTGAQGLLPRWLKKASAKEDHGKDVSDKFLHLELDEKSRMTKALSSGVSYGTLDPDTRDVQIAGVEKGAKNRYNNIWPFEHSRVKLHGRAEGACDYINANHIKASRSNKRYIASQGPLPATFDDFWSIIWDQDVRVIVMLTAESEGGQLKCHPYWSTKEFGPLRLKALSEKKVSLDPKIHRSTTADRRGSFGRRRANTTNIAPTASEDSPSPPPSEIPHAIIRKFTLSHAAHPFSPMREITQIHYASWPDFGAPAKPSQLLGLVELGDVMQRASASFTFRADEPEPDVDVRPILVHCSAGCGRTGTFCTVDSVIDMLKRQRKEMRSGTTPMEVDIPPSRNLITDSKISGDWIFDQDLDLVQKTVEDFRGQRISMVQSLRQFVLCYETVLEWISQQNSARQHGSTVVGNSAAFGRNSELMGDGVGATIKEDGNGSRTDRIRHSKSPARSISGPVPNRDRSGSDGAALNMGMGSEFPFGGR